MKSLLAMLLVSGLLIVSSLATAQHSMDGSTAIREFSGHDFAGKSPSGKTQITLTLRDGKYQQEGMITFTGELKAEALAAGGVNDRDALKKAVFDPKTNILRIQAGWASGDLTWNGQAFTGPINYGPTHFAYTLQKQKPGR